MTASNTNANANVNAEPKKVLTRDEARAQAFNAKPISYPAVFNGVDVILLEPSLAEIMSAQADEDRKRGAATMLIRFVHLPDGTPLFEEADIEVILQMPFNADMRNLNLKIQQLIGVMPSTEDKSTTEVVAD